VPDAALRPCAGNCGAKVKRGRCSACTTRVEQRRGSAWQRGYDRDWNHFRNVTFPALLAEVGLIPMCGVALPGGPALRESLCKQAGFYVSGPGLQLHHDPPLQDWEQEHPEIVCQPLRCGFLCRACHTNATFGKVVAR